ncbi:MAG: sodium/proline symporter [Acetobacter sp.]|nr:sodium/proline symporter [Bacteroides sp.]MCM1341008.1 sodium/proline symporter [Acetobacter sp.]MCM1432436.1 sodium/proline symporter [Clostridiales bacterium]
MTTSQICIMISIVAYLSIVVIIGVIYSKKTKNVGDFYLGGRKLGPLVTAMSAEASDMSSYLLMGLPGLALAAGLAEVGWTTIGLAVGTYFNWLIVAKLLRNYSAKIGAITIPDYFSLRYKDKSRVLMAIAAVMIIIFFVPYTASGFAACGKLFGTLFGVDYHIAMIISAIVIVGYTSLGGFTAASITDFIQSIIMTIALLIVLGFGIYKAGGMDAVIENARNLSGYLNMFQGYNAETNSAGTYSALSVVSTLAWGLGYFGMPHILLRFMAIENPDKIKLSRRVASVWVVISMAIAVLIGVVGMSMIKAGVIPAIDDSETIIIQIATYLADSGIIPALIAGIILAGILASTMSTADSQLLAASSAASENIVGGLFKIKLSETGKMVIARVTLIIISVIGVFIAWDSNSSVFGIVSFAWAGFGAVFGPVVILSLFWKRSNKYGAIAGMIVGGVMVFLWKNVISGLAPILNIYELLPAFVISIVVNIVVSLLTPKPEQSIIDDFEAVKAMNKKK